MQSPARLVQGSMKRISILMFAVEVVVGSMIVSMPFALGGPGGEDTSPIFGVTIPAGCRQWELIAPSHEEGFDELRGILGNTLSMKAHRDGTLPFPDGAMPAKLARKRVPSSEFKGAFVPSTATTVQIMIKDSKQYVSTGGWDLAGSSTASRWTRPSTKRASLVTRPT